MAFFGEWLRRIGYLFNRRRIERDLQREMEMHREMMGEPVRFGNMLRLREESRDVWGWNWLDMARLQICSPTSNCCRQCGLGIENCIYKDVECRLVISLDVHKFNI